MLVGGRSLAPPGQSQWTPRRDKSQPQVLLPNPRPELSGQLHPGNRILAFAPAYATLRRGKPEPGRAVAPSEGGQGDNSFVEAHSLSLRDIVQMVRGAPGTLLQLQVLSADAPPNSPPRTVPIIRDQIRFKQ